MFWDLKGATRKPRSLRRRQMAATSVLLPEWEVVPRTTRKRDMGYDEGVQVYLPFGRWSFANLPINKAESSWSIQSRKTRKRIKKKDVVFLALHADLIEDHLGLRCNSAGSVSCRCIQKR